MPRRTRLSGERACQRLGEKRGPKRRKRGGGTKGSEAARSETGTSTHSGPCSRCILRYGCHSLGRPVRREERGGSAGGRGTRYPAGPPKATWLVRVRGIGAASATHVVHHACALRPTCVGVGRAERLRGCWRGRLGGSLLAVGPVAVWSEAVVSVVQQSLVSSKSQSERVGDGERRRALVHVAHPVLAWPSLSPRHLTLSRVAQ